MPHHIQVAECDDCVIFSSESNKCTLCGGWREVVPLMIQIARATGKSKVVIIGGCESAPSYDERSATPELLEIFAAQHVELCWLDKTGTACRTVKRILPDFDFSIRKFADARVWEIAFPHLLQFAERISEIKRRIQIEQEVVERMPLVFPVKSLEWHLRVGSNNNVMGANFLELLDIRFKEEVAPANMAVLFSNDGATGELVTKSNYFPFEVVEEYRRDLFRYDHTTGGSLRIRLKGSAMELSLYSPTAHSYKLEPHPAIDLMNPETHWVPMWQRIEEVKES